MPAACHPQQTKPPFGAWRPTKRAQALTSRQLPPRALRQRRSCTASLRTTNKIPEMLLRPRRGPPPQPGVTSCGVPQQCSCASVSTPHQGRETERAAWLPGRLGTSTSTPAAARRYEPHAALSTVVDETQTVCGVIGTRDGVWVMVCVAEIEILMCSTPALVLYYQS